MSTLLACLSSGKGTWTEVIKVVNNRPWTKVFLITDHFGQENFRPRPPMELVVVDFQSEPQELIGQIKKGLQGNIADFEVGLNLASGNGKEHMALLEAVLELGLNFRLVTVQNGQVEILGLRK